MRDKKFYKQGETCKYIPAKATYEHLPSAVIKNGVILHHFYRDIPKRKLGRCFWKISACLQMLVLEL